MGFSTLDLDLDSVFFVRPLEKEKRKTVNHHSIIRAHQDQIWWFDSILMGGCFINRLGFVCIIILLLLDDIRCATPLCVMTFLTSSTVDSGLFIQHGLAWRQ